MRKFFCLGFAFVAACGSAAGDQDTDATNAAGGSSVTGGSGGASAGASGAGATAGSAGAKAGGAGTGIGTSGSSGASGGTTGGAGGGCSAVSQQAESKLTPADIVWIIDNSGSMTQEAKWVQQHMNTFSSKIVASGIDVHVVLISSASNQTNGVCIPTPLGSGTCPADTKLPTFLHDVKTVASTNALSLLVSEYPNYKSALRAGAARNFVVVTDDDSAMTAADFKTKITALDPAGMAGFKLHGIFSYDAPSVAGPCQNVAAKEGKVYKTLVKDTGGVSGNLCAQDFAPVFDQLATAVISGAKLACEWAIPAPPSGETLDPAKVNVRFTASSGAVSEYGKVANAAACTGVKNGWYYDNDAKPTKVIACPQTCTELQKDPKGKIEVLFGCTSKLAEPGLAALPELSGLSGGRAASSVTACRVG